MSDGTRPAIDTALGSRRARAATLLMLALPGSAYIYQGEELGLHEVADLPHDVLQDPTWERSGHRDKGRDGCRVPIPWEPTGDSFGFGPGGSWLPQPAAWSKLARSVQAADAGSTLTLYREALRLRREFGGDGQLEWIEKGPQQLAFRRDSGLTCVVNFGPEPVELPAGELLLASGPLAGSALPADTAAWLTGRPLRTGE
jgi:alpha-glucosidase